ncbi:MAG TPA: transcription-repair coupling factor [Bacilli bacterium]|nr:transcription-repair coupling factor [Bacilli bacterium]
MNRDDVMNIFSNIIKTYNENNIGLKGMNLGFFSLYLNKLLKETDNGIIVVTPTIYEANKLYQNFSDTKDVFLYETDDVLTSLATSKSPELKVEKLNILKESLNNNKKIIITDINGYLKKLPSINDFKNNIIKLKIGTDINLKNIVDNLYEIGYEKETLVTKPGEFGVRGFILDIFPLNEENPIRIEFFGDTIESIRYFEVESQKSLENIDEIEIYSISKTSEKYSSLYEYLNNPLVIFKDYSQIKISYERIMNDIFELNIENPLYDINDIGEKKINYYFDLDDDTSLAKKVVNFNIKNVEKFNSNIEIINKYLEESLKFNKTVIICLSTINVNNFIEILNIPYLLTDIVNIKENNINIVKYDLKEGFILDNYIFISEYELYNKKKETKRRKFNFNFATRIKDLNKLEIGDYVVHDSHGIGVYNGIKTLSKNNMLQDYIEVLYADNDKLYIPASKIELISKYTGKEGYAPKINSLNSVAWEKTKQRVKEKIRYEASRLLKVQAERSLKKGFPFSKDSEMQTLFENEFIYELTQDQIKAINEMKKDMESDLPMDRILCGDVGYGKTEVAFRAAFKAIYDSKQVLYLCPTTLLSKQQYESALERFKNYPVKIGLLNRFTSKKEEIKILKELEEGNIDFVIGTHRLLSDDIKPKDLGLLIIDEEQRFGVAHKEKLKEFKSNIDILTLTATPIPRTMQMAMVGLRNLSLIETPPKNRHAVLTYVLEENNKIIKDIIYKEMSREGQVFILYNKVETIERKVKELQLLVPDARIIYAHGKLPKNELEDIMNKFINKEYDCLVCTTIIETGIDIPNANSLIIYDASNFGLSQLYQIRGRVGRSERTAYAYLMYNKNKTLTETAIKRLKVIKEFTELGSGFNIAARDLSIRGAGDILGAEQAGFIDAVGIELYMKMLNNEIKILKGEKIEEEKIKQTPLIEVNNHIDNNYVSEEELKLTIHKMINNITNIDSYNDVKKELEDRFGRLDNNMIIYMNEELFESYLRNLEGKILINNDLFIEIVFSKEISEKIDYEDLIVTSLNISKDIIFSYKDNKLHIKLKKYNKDKSYIITLNNLLEKMC